MVQFQNIILLLINQQVINECNTLSRVTVTIITVTDLLLYI